MRIERFVLSPNWSEIVEAERVLKQDVKKERSKCTYSKHGLLMQRPLENCIQARSRSLQQGLVTNVWAEEQNISPAPIIDQDLVVPNTEL